MYTSITRRVSTLFLILALGFSVLGAASYFLTGTAPAVPDNPIYRDISYSNDERVADLLSHMTLEEKIGQMTLVEKNSIKRSSDISTYGIGALLSGFGGRPEDNSIEGWRDMIIGFIAESKQSRLGIPILYGVDAIHGHSNVPRMTVFPHAIGLGASGDADLVKRVAQATKEQLVATGVNWSYSPTYDMPQDIRWGRVYETFSDDPELVSTLGAAYIEGLQQSENDTSGIEVLATPKHFIGAGSMLWDTSSNENFNLDQGTTQVSEEKLYAHYLPPFIEAVDAGALSIMVGLNSWGETKLAAEGHLITDVLKGELGFSGFTVSDWYGVYEVTENDYESAVLAINAGIDMVMLPFDYKPFIRNVKKAVARGEISEVRIDDAVTRILRAKFSSGLFEQERAGEIVTIDTDAHRALAREAVAKSAVLLKNTNSILPISPRTDSILVAGSAADNVGMQSGAWTLEWQGVDGNWIPNSTSILEGIKEVAGSGTSVTFEENAYFESSQEKASLGIAVVGEKPYAEGWGDNASPSLSTQDLETIARLQEVSEKVVVVLVTGRPLIITDELENWDALVIAWLPGGEGGGVADVLFGAAPFTANLPLPWPATVSQLPISTDGTTKDGTNVLFPRYFGLNP